MKSISVHLPFILFIKQWKKVKKLGEHFEWEKDNLEFAGIGSPAFRVTQLKGGEDGNGSKYKPVVSFGVRKRRARMIRHIDIVVGEIIPVWNFETHKEIGVMGKPSQI